MRKAGAHRKIRNFVSDTLRVVGKSTRIAQGLYIPFGCYTELPRIIFKPVRSYGGTASSY